MRVSVTGLLSGQNIVNVFHMSDTTNSTRVYVQGQLDAMSTQIRNAWKTTFLPRQSATDFQLSQVLVQDIGHSLGLVGVAAGTDNGGRPGTSLPANVACCVSWRTPLHFRGGHARTYLAGAVQADQNGATSWASASITAWLTAATNFLAAIQAPVASMTPVMCMLSRTRGGVLFDPPERYSISSPVIDTRIDSMRRRLGKDR